VTTPQDPQDPFAPVPPPAPGQPPPYGAPPAYGVPAGYGPPAAQQPYGQFGAGQQPYGPPAGYGPPGYGPPGYGPPPSLDPNGRPGMATAALVLGILGFFTITAVLAIVFGVLGRGQAQRQGRKGKTMATWGLGLGVAWLAVVVGLIAYGATQDDFTDLRKGDCLKTVELGAGKSVRDLDPSSCTGQHQGEVYATFDSALTGSDYPGSTRLLAEAERRCVAAADGVVDEAKLNASSDLNYFVPDKSTWEIADARNIVCLVVGDPRRGSVLVD
jgi:hypothetical protein